MMKLAILISIRLIIGYVTAVNALDELAVVSTIFGASVQDGKRESDIASFSKGRHLQIEGGEQRRLEEVFLDIEYVWGNSTGDLLSVIDGLVVSGLIPADIVHFWKGFFDEELNSVDNRNPAIPCGSSIYPHKSPADAPYSIEEEKLRAAIHIPESFSYGKGGKKPVILVPGTSIPAGTTYYYNFGKLEAIVPEADIVWINIPGSSLDDVQINSEYVAYAINYISAISHSNISAVIGWSQGTVNTQWAFKYWPSTREVVDNLLAISADFHGTMLPCKLLIPFLCAPSLLQQAWDSDFTRMLRADGGDSAYVPTTTFYSTFDEIVQPMSGKHASAILYDSRSVGVSNIHIQSVCPFQPAGGVYLHEGLLYNSLVWALVADAIRNGGPGDVSRIDLEAVCAEFIAPGLGLDDFLGTEGLLVLFLSNAFMYQPKPPNEPPIMEYARTCIEGGKTRDAS